MNGIIGGQSLVLLQRIIVGSTPANLPNTTYYATAQTSLTFSGLTGDTTIQYGLFGRIVAAGNDSATLNFNGVVSSVYDYRDTGTTTNSTNNVYTGTAQTFIQIGISSGASTIDTLNLSIMALSGKNRQVLGQYLRGGSSGNDISAVYQSSGVWRNSANEITSITLGYASQVNGFLSGTHIMLYGLV
jgi:hypothetical protein